MKRYKDSWTRRRRDLMGAPEAQAEAEELSRQAAAVPAMARLREVVAFVGNGRPATQAGNLKAPDAVALAGRLATGEQVPDRVRSMEDVPDTAHAFRWAAAASSPMREVMARNDAEVVLTGLGGALAAIVAFTSDDEEDVLDLVDTDAQSLLLVCVEEMESADARAHLLAWCAARPAEEAAAELCEAMLDDDDPDVWDLGFEALDMIDRAVAEPAVRRLRSHPGLRPRATARPRRHGPAPSPPMPR